MNKITVEEITQDLIHYLQRVNAGESFIIFQANQPIAKIISAKTEGILDAFDGFRSRIIAEAIDVDSDKIFADVRDDTPTPEEPRW